MNKYLQRQNTTTNKYFTTMRKISQQSSNAFVNGQNFKSANMEVRVTAGSIQMLLHGNLIAERTAKKLYINSCGWKTNTTKERLNSIPSVNISQAKGLWYLNGELWDGSLKQLVWNN